MAARWDRCTFVLFVMSSVLAWSSVDSVAEELSLGINLNRVVDYNPSWVFVDAIKQSRPWVSVAFNAETGEEKWGDGGPLPLNQFGMPTSLRAWQNEAGQQMQQRAVTLAFREIGDAFPAGIYQAEWKGRGRVEFSLSGKVIEQGTRPDGTSFANVDVQPSDAGIMIKIVETDSDDPIRDLHLWLPSFDGINFAKASRDEGSSPFHPLFKQRLEPFSTLRFLDWTATNWTTEHEWAERTLVRNCQQSGHNSGKGVALEYVIRLANELEKDVWINTPPWADDEYVRSMAELFREHLNPDLKIYVEWANELWNFAPGFATHPWVKEQAARPENRGLSHWRVAAKNIKQDMVVWSDVFSKQPNRIVRVVAGQSANPWVAKELIQRVGLANIDAVACSCYIQLTKEQRSRFTAATSAEDVIAAARANLPRVQSELAAHKRLTDMCSKIAKRPIRLVAYEGGQHFDAGGKDVPYLQALYDVQSDPAIETLYSEMLDIAENAGVQLLNHYAYIDRNSIHGTWSALSRQDQPTSSAPKYRALISWIQKSE